MGNTYKNWTVRHNKHKVDEATQQTSKRKRSMQKQRAFSSKTHTQFVKYNKTLSESQVRITRECLFYPTLELIHATN